MLLTTCSQSLVLALVEAWELAKAPVLVKALERVTAPVRAISRTTPPATHTNSQVSACTVRLVNGDNTMYAQR
jgi:uncharacterized protein with von Willebrand factor type A (vWA) domain